MEKTLNTKMFIHADDYGRSEIISKNIIQCIDSGSINSVSIMLGSNKEVYKEIKKYNIKKKIHINLTDFDLNLDINNQFLRDLTFMKLLFLRNKNKRIVLNEVDRQIQEYKKIFNEEELMIDGHQHVHVIPWVYKHLIEKYKNEATEIRLPDEAFFFGGVKGVFNPKFYRNLVAFLLLKLLIRVFIKETIYSPPFSGMLYSGIYTKEIFKKNFKYLTQKYETFEIAFHPGYTSEVEKDLFKKETYKYYSSKKRKIEYKLAVEKNIFI